MGTRLSKNLSVQRMKIGLSSYRCYTSRVVSVLLYSTSTYIMGLSSIFHFLRS
jgi:hypothetical protein